MSKGKRWFYGLLLAFAVLLLYSQYFILQPLHREVAAQKEALAALRVDAALVTDRLQEQRKLAGKIDLEPLLAALPVEEDAARLIAVLEALEKSAGLVVHHASFTDSQADGLKLAESVVLPAWFVELDFTATLPQLDRFLAELEEQERLLGIDRLEYAAVAESGSIRGKMTVKAVYAEPFAAFIP